MNEYTYTARSPKLVGVRKCVQLLPLKMAFRLVTVFDLCAINPNVTAYKENTQSSRIVEKVGKQRLHSINDESHKVECGPNPPPEPAKTILDEKQYNNRHQNQDNSTCTNNINTKYVNQCRLRQVQYFAIFSTHIFVIVRVHTAMLDCRSTTITTTRLNTILLLFFYLALDVFRYLFNSISRNIKL